MTVVGLDDTDSRERGMCTTYVAAEIARRLRREGEVARLLLVRLNPAVEHKTRGNAALAIHADCDPDRAFAIARERLEARAESADERTNPGLVVAGHEPAATPDAVRRFARRAVRDRLEIADAEQLIATRDYRAWTAGNGRGRIGALAAVGSWAARSTWTYEHICYREPDRWGTPREVDFDSVFAAAAEAYPAVWDTVDRGEGEAVCVPHTPGPVLYGIRGDDPDAVRAVADRIESEPVDASQLFVTNQGTDAHLRDGTIGDLRDGRSYRVDGRVATFPETRRGGHVFVELESASGPERDRSDADPERDTRDPDPERDTRSPDPERDSTGACLPCAAFEPTKRFRDRVRALRPGDRLTICGEVSRGTLKLEKFAVRDLVRTERVVPTCPDCERRMESAGRNQGYRCRDCGTTAPEKRTVPVERDLEAGWYEVPPCARRHVAKPLIRGGFDAPIHPER